MIRYNNENIKDYKIGYLLSEFDDRLSFRYNKLRRTDINKIDLVDGFDYLNKTFTIVTKSNLDFKPELLVELSGNIYKIQTLYTDEYDEYDGNVITTNVKKTYLVLKK